MDNFNQRSAAWRQTHGAHLDLSYGAAPRNRIDYFAAPKPGTLLIFIHGGYWQMRAKENFSFLAAGPLAHGIHVAMVGYTLAPDISLMGNLPGKLLPLAQHNHFTILNELADPDGSLTREVCLLADI